MKEFPVDTSMVFGEADQRYLLVSTNNSVFSFQRDEYSYILRLLLIVT